MNIISKQSTVHSVQVKTSQAEVQSPSGGTSKSGHPNLPPSLTTTALSDAGASTDSIALEQRLRRQSLESLVDVLRSLVAWKNAANKTSASAPNGVFTPTDQAQTRLSINEETKYDGNSSSDAILERLSPARAGSIDLRTSTPELMDDPSRFENAKQRKTTLLEGIKKFNFKPKRVSF